MLKILFVGSKNMGYSALNTLIYFQSQYLIELIGVIARADDEEKHWYCSVSKLAQKHGLNLFKPDSLTDEGFLHQMQQLDFDLGICCFYPKLFKHSFYSVARQGFINLHFAPLPKYRGALPIPHAIMNDEKEHGVTIHKIDSGMDSGDIVSQKLVPIYSNDTGFDLYSRCEIVGQILFHETLQMMVNSGLIPPSRKQDENAVISYVRKDLKSKEINPNWNFLKLYNFVRALDFPTFELPYVVQNDINISLSTRPERHKDSYNIEPSIYAELNSQIIWRMG